jgi:branched-chain amino acid transport system substrate-binding protein
MAPLGWHAVSPPAGFLTGVISMRAYALPAVASLLCAVALAGCTGANRNSEIVGRSLTIYSSLPLEGSDANRALDVQRAEQLALKQAGNRVRKFKLKFVGLNDASRSTGRWQPSKVSSNARKAAQDKHTVAYLGELDSGGSAVSIPILDQAGILQVSPADGLAELTRKQGDKRGPAKYYPEHDRNFGRVVPPDDIQAAALVTYMHDLGVRRPFVLDDGGGYGVSIADQIKHVLYGRISPTLRPRDVPADTFTPEESDVGSVTRKVLQSGADALIYAGASTPTIVRLWQSLHAASPRLKLFGPNELGEPSFYTAVGPAGASTYLTDPSLPLNLRPPAARAFVADFRREYHTAPDPYALFGYEAMNAVLQSIRHAGSKANDRKRVIDAFFGLRRPNSVLGPYTIDRNGDISPATFAGYRVRGGKLVFDRVLKPAAGSPTP